VTAKRPSDYIRCAMCGRLAERRNAAGTPFGLVRRECFARAMAATTAAAEQALTTVNNGCTVEE
jgi:hypothetical protein